MIEYLEFPPPRELITSVECFWTMWSGGKAGRTHRVAPDGCADILFTRQNGASRLQVVGPMTTYEDVALAAGELSVGVRFRPGFWSRQIGVPADLVTNRIIPLAEIWNARAKELQARMEEGLSAENCVAILRKAIVPEQQVTAAQLAIQRMETLRGWADPDEVARQANLSMRQFRRVCLRETGLTPKFLARVLRFRRTLQIMQRRRGDDAAIAAECGYADQSHMIAEVRRFSGRTPQDHRRMADTNGYL